MFAIPIVMIPTKKINSITTAIINKFFTEAESLNKSDIDTMSAINIIKIASTKKK